jgi:hypothetical protein
MRPRLLTLLTVLALTEPVGQSQGRANVKAKNHANTIPP